MRIYVARLVIPDVSEGRNALILKGEVLSEKKGIFRDLLTPPDAPKNVTMKHFNLTPHLHYNQTGKRTLKCNNTVHARYHSRHLKALSTRYSECVCVCVCLPVCNLRYPARNARAPYCIVISALSGS